MHQNPGQDRALRRVRWKKRLVVAGLSATALWFFAWTGLQLAVRAKPFPTDDPATRYGVSHEWFSADGERLGYSPAADGCVRIPVTKAAMSPWLAKATEAVEDRRFRSHDGVDNLRVLRAAWDDLTRWKKVSGASTIPMQICKLTNPRPRTLSAKADEALMAMRLDRAMSKDDQMTCYLNLAPYGGNRVGVEAACRAYFGKSAKNLTLAEAALIAGLPQSPTRLRPDRHPEAAKIRRARVLAAMEDCGFITASQRAAAEREPVIVVPPESSSPVAPHFLALAKRERPDGGVTTLDASLQRDVARLLAGALSGRDASLQAAAVVTDLKTGATLAWVGSVPGHAASSVDHARRRRSPGSTPKTFVYGAAFEAHRIAPDTPLKDAALDRFGWAPRNFDNRERGDITAEDALRESLNLPALALARSVGLARCVALATACGAEFRPGDLSRAGLSWVVGGAETTLASLTDAHATIGNGGVTAPRRLFPDTATASPARVLPEETCAALDHCLGVSDAHVPAGWESLDESRRAWFMWKTGTSSGGRDAWAVGHNGRYAAGVWVGTTKGRTRDKVFSRKDAEPALAAIFSLPRLKQSAPRLPHVGDWWPVVVKTVETPRIVAPAANVELLAPEGVTTLWPKTERGEPGVWFLDGAPLDAADLRPLRVKIGAHELRFVTPDGESAGVKFKVTSPE